MSSLLRPMAANLAPASAGGAVARAARKLSGLVVKQLSAGAFASGMLLCANTNVVYADTAPNTLITNTAQATYKHLNVSQQAQTDFTFITARNSDGSGTPSVITLMHNNADFSSRGDAIDRIKNPRSTRALTTSTRAVSNGSFPVRAGECANDSSLQAFSQQALPTTSDGRDVALPAQVNLRSDEFFKVGDTIYIHLQDLDQNTDPTKAEDILVTLSSDNGLDKETIRLWETGNSTGTFTGYIPSVHLDNVSAQHFDCRLSVRNDSEMEASYVDAFDSIDISLSRALFDPSSIIFDSNSGTAVDGIQVTLIDTETGLPAVVLGDDGTSTFPNPIVAGEAVTDASGRNYNFPAGGFRFPVIAPGDYRIQLGDSVFYDFPSLRSDEIINQLSNGPFLLGPASRGLDFAVSGNAFQVDVPIDPKDNSVLLTKTAHKTKAGVGEYVRYSIQIKNAEVPGENVLIHDRLPRGFRYEKGTAKINNQDVADPTITEDGRTLSFSIATLNPDTTYTLSYVTRIGVSTPIGPAQNLAWLEDDHLVGNQTQKTIEILDDLFTLDARLFGRVYLGSCDNDNPEANIAEHEQYGEGVPGVRIYLENGTYVVTDEDGLWHIEGQQPGTHVVQLDTDSLPPYMDLMSCDEQGFHAGRGYSQFVDIQPGSFWRTDFVVKLKPPAEGAVTQHLSSYLSVVEDAERAQHPQLQDSPVPQKLNYQLDAYGTEVILKKLRALVILPAGVHYLANSARFDGKPLAEPKKYDEQTLLFTLNDPGKDWQHKLNFEAVITPDAEPGELSTRSVIMFNSPAQNNQRTPVAFTSALLALVPKTNMAHKPDRAPTFQSFSRELTEADKQEMQRVIEALKGISDLRIEVAGHTDNVPIARRSRHIFANNQALSMARARSAADYLMQQLNLQPEQVSIAGYGASRPVAQNKNDSMRALNRRVEVRILGGKNNMQVSQADSGEQMVVTTGVAPGGFDWPVEATAAIASGNIIEMPLYDSNWLSQQNDDFRWEWPLPDMLPNIPSTKIAIKHPMGTKLRLTLNGKPVNELNRSGRAQYSPNNNAVSLWSGVDLREGSNLFVASLLDKNDVVIDKLDFQLHYSGSPIHAELIEEESKAIADGIAAPVIAVRLTDKQGFPVRKGLHGEFSVNTPYVALDPNKDKAQINRSSFTPTYEVQEDGMAYLTLEPTTQAGEAVVQFPFINGIEEEVRLWLKPQNRDWMLIALGEGTVGYSDLSGHINNAQANGNEKEFWSDGRVALFAKGQIKGEWLITAAYDSAKGETTPFEKLLDPNKYYTLYGDNSQQKLDASMEGKLYVRVEKERFYTVFGDYSTDLNKTELTSYLRKFHGIQSVFQGDIVSFNVFATETAQRYVRDEIQGDGTSGLYRLSNADLIENTEAVKIQVRDRFRSDVILEEIELSKNSDYVIDYVDGTLFFKSPIRSTDDNFNPRFIIVSYETASSDEDNITYGGRAAVHVLDKKVEVGATIIEEDQGQQTQRMQGVDLRLQVTPALHIKTEVAKTDTQLDDGTATNDEAHASLVSVEYRGEQLQTKAYVKRRTAGFGLGQLNASEDDTLKTAVEGTYYFTSASYLEALANDQQALTGDNRQQLVEAKFNQEYRYGRYRLGGRVSTVSTDSNEVVNQQLLAGHSMSLLEGSLLFNVDGEFNLRRDNEQYDLIRLGGDYRFTNEITLFAIHEDSWDHHAPQRSTMGLRTTPWEGAQLSNSVQQENTKDGSRLFAVNGLNQEVNLNDLWQISFSFDQSKDLENTMLADSGAVQEDFYSGSVGWGYRSQAWQWTNRLEYRDATSGHKWNAITGLFHPVSAGLAMGISGEYRLEDTGSFTRYRKGEFDIGLRPMSWGLAWLNQSKYIVDEQQTGDTDTLSRRLVNNTHINYTWKRSQISAQYGLKYVTDQIDHARYDGFVDLMGAEYRHHITPRWDWGVHARRIHDYEHGDSLRNLGASIGYIPRANTWVSFGYNYSGFVDTDFNNAAYTAQGIYLKLRVKADQDSLRQLNSYFE